MCRILVVEDSELQRFVIMTKLKRQLNEKLELITATCLEEAKVLVEEHCHYDIIILDLGLPDSTGISTFSDLKSTCPNIPVIVYTAEDDFAIALECIKQGAETVLIKPEIEPLLRAVAFILEKHKMRKRLEEMLRSKMQDVACEAATTLQQAKETLLETAGQLGVATEEKRKWVEAGTVTTCV